MQNLLEENVKAIVQDRYAKIATNDQPISCCGTSKTVPQNKIYNIMMDDYTGTDGYLAEADLGLGCGLPTQFAQINPGNTVIDLGSGAGNDCFVARHEVGPTGKVIGVDFTPAMIQKARANAEKLGFNNVEFREGDIDNLPISSNLADVVVSNCVLNLVPNKPKVMGEMFRVLKPGGHFSVSDIVLVGKLPAALQQDAEMYAGCVAGASQKEDYLNTIEGAGFTDVVIQKTKPISLPTDLLQKYLSEDEIAAFTTGSTGIFSITVFGKKPADRMSPAQPVLTPISQNSCCS